MKTTTQMSLALLAALACVAPSSVAGAGAPAPQAGQAALWAEAAKMPNLWEGTWQGDTNLYGFPGPIEYTPSAAAYVKNYKPVDDMNFANCKHPGMPFAMRIAAMPIKFYYSPHERMISIYI